MPRIYLSRLIGLLIAVCSVIVIYLGLQSPPRTTSTPLTGTTWSVTSSSDNVYDGSVISHTGSLRFALAHATSGDIVRFVINAENTIVANSTLTVPAGVAVGRTRAEGCGNANTPRANIRANLDPSIIVDPVFSLGVSSTLRNVDVGGGINGVKITGANVDVCGVGLGIQSSGETNTLPPKHAALIIDGDHAVIHRNILFSNIVVGIHGSDSRIGDTLYENGDGNEAWCSPVILCAVTIITGSSSAAQRVTIRDALPRSLLGMPGNGVYGGDDDPKHANNWAQTPMTLTAETFDNYATVHVSGIANPLSLVDIYFYRNGVYTRELPITATAAGTFDFWGALPGPAVPIQIIGASTLNDSAHPNRVGSSSQFSGLVQVMPGVDTAVLHLTPAALTFSALVGDANLPDQYLFVAAPTISPTLAWQASVTTTDGLSWLDALPSLGSGDGLITVTVNATGLTAGTYHGTVTVFDPAQPTDQAMANVTLDVTAPDVYGVTLTPSAAAKSGDPGATVAYTLRITNTGSTTDTFDVTSPANWTTTIPATIGPLASGKGANLTVQVDVPSDALGGATDTADVTVTSQGDASMWATAELMTTANAIYGGVIDPPSAEQSGDAGTTVTYTLRVTNTGNLTDTFAVIVAGDFWTTTVPATIGPLESGAGEDLTVTVDIPSSASNTASDMTIISLASQGDPAQGASALLTTTANALRGVRLEPSSEAQFGDAGTTVTYTLRMTNTGTLTDVLTLSDSGSAWEVGLSATPTELPADAGLDVMVVVSIPVAATGGMTDTVQLLVTGTGVSDTSALVTAVNFKAYLPLTLNDNP